MSDLWAQLRFKLGQVRQGLRLYTIPQWLGRASLLCNRFHYPEFHVGQGARIWGRFMVVMYGHGDITVGENLRMISQAERSGLILYSPCKLTTYEGGRIVIGDNVAMNGTVITSRTLIEIGERTIIAPNVMIIDSDFHVPWPPQKRFDLSPTRPEDAVQIGCNVWIGMNSIITRSVTIGENAVIGAGSVVTRDVPANCLAAGNPARVVRQLDEEEPGEG